ncbi:hypothetical protein TUM19329_26290 [Legionella antarctica]|uniref:SidE PDE domain-containing protein n=1 Tax=Legionella antarctica TaxID=2708020 RepID=A0A6F8T779_9GAMM|nr:SidE phosphodiesterase domain-containing protein [Legionella antarctica]BCA96268.1 hypothetical protein TUM19329_26290 [Legionella antarctica]
MNELVVESTSSHGNPYQVKLVINSDWLNFWHNESAEHEFFQALADNVINIPYVDDGYYLLETNGVVIYRPNHDVGHALRQAANSQLLFEVIELHGQPEMKLVLQELTQEERAAIRLAAYLFRAGRTNEHGGKNDPSNAERSALLFSEIAKAVGFNAKLIDDIALSMCNHAPIMDDVLSKTIPYDGFAGTQNIQIGKSRLVKAVLDISHHSDLVRCWGDVKKINSNNWENLSGLLQPESVKASNDILLNFARAGNALTGTPYYKHNGTYDKFIPPIQLRKNNVLQVAHQIAALSQMAAKFVPLIAEQDSEKTNEMQSAVEALVQEEKHEAQAANIIKRAYRINRAHRNTKQAVNVIPPKVSLKNLKYLKQQMAEGHGLPVEDKARLNGQILLPEEDALNQFLLHEFDWVLKHVTPDLPVIKENGNALKSLHQRSREARANDVRFTSDFEGRSDNIYFTISSSNGRPAEFLQLSEGHEVRVPIRPFMNAEGIPGDKLSGLWLSSAWYGYSAARQLNARVDDVKRTVQYTKKNTGQRFISEDDYKLYQWKYSDGSKISRIVPFGYETISGSDILPFLALNTIFELRHTTQAFRQTCLRNPQGPVLEAFVDMVYEQRNFEALIPATLPLNDNRIDILPFNQTHHLCPDAAANMTRAIDSGKIEEIDALLEQGYPIDLKLEAGVTPLGYCLLKSNGDIKWARNAAIYFINQGANIQTTVHELSLLTMAVGNRDYPIVKALLTKGIHDKRTHRVKLYLDINRDEKAIVCAVMNQDIMMIRLFSEYGLSFLSMPQSSLLYLADMNEFSAMEIFQVMVDGGFQFNDQKIYDQQCIYDALEQCIKNQKYELLEAFLKAGCNPDIKNYNTGLPILSYARKTKDLKSCDLLIKSGADTADAMTGQSTHVHLMVKNNKGKLLLIKRRREDGSMSSFWQPLDYMAANFSEDAMLATLFSATGLRPVSYELIKITEVSQQDEVAQVYELKILDNNIRANDTEYFALPIWLDSRVQKDLPMANLARLFLENKSVNQINLALSQHHRLVAAIENQNIQEARFCLRDGVIDQRQTALFKACDLKSPNQDIVLALLDYGYDINAINKEFKDPMTPLMFAILHRNLRLAECLLSKGANPNQAVGKLKVTPLMFAAKSNALDMMDLLQRNGASYEHPANKGVLAYAMLFLCSDKTFDYLLSRADCNGFYFKYTSVLIAAERGEDARIKCLLEKNVDLTVKHPRLRQTADIIYSGKDRKVFDDYQCSKRSKKVWWELEREYQVYLDYSGATERSRVDEELAIEYRLTMISETEHEFLFNFFEDILNRCHPDISTPKPIFAIAHEGQGYVRIQWTPLSRQRSV